MPTIQPTSTTRVTGVMTRGRITAQIQSDQLDLFRLQNQLSTGFRVFLPSDDAPAAQRAIVLQRTLERKEQSLTNLRGAENGLNTTWNSLANVNNQLNDLKSTALGAIGTFSSQTERDELIAEIDLAISAIQDAGNATFTSTFLLSGAERSSQAYEAVTGGYIEYLGDESTPRTFVDVGQLFDSGSSGNDSLGGLSDSVRGSVDLNLQLTPDTRLSKLNGGLGVSPNGSIEVTFTPTSPSDPSTLVVIDLSDAVTIDDVSRLINAGAPAGSELVATVRGNGLHLEATGGGITVGEVANGQTARELGILTPPTPSPSVEGTDLNPTIDLTDRLDDLVGAKARGRIVSGGDNNDLVLTANANGEQFNDVAVDYVSGTALATTYDAPPINTLTVTIVEGESTAADIAAAINSNTDVPFTAEPDYRDQTSLADRGTGRPTATAGLAVGVQGGADGAIDVASGFLVTNGDVTYTIDTANAETVEDILSELNRPEYGLVATINTAGTGIDVRTRRSGADFAIAENGGTTATDLGIRTYTEQSRLADFNRGVGVLVETPEFDNPAATLAERINQNGFRLSVTEDGVTTEYTIDPGGLETVEDLIQRIDEETNGEVEASLATVGNGLVLTVTDPDSPAVEASGSFALGANDTLTITAEATGPAGNRPFTVEVRDSGGAGPLDVSVTGDAIVVDLQGLDATTEAIAQEIENELAGFTVSADDGGDGFETIAALTTPPGTVAGPINAATINGAAASVDAVAASGSFTLNGDAITLTADSTGPEGNGGFTINLVNDGTGGLETTVDPNDPSVVTVNLGGSDSDTAAIAASLSATIPGYSVASDGAPPAAVVQADAGTPAAPVPFAATLSGGRAVDSITVSGSYAQRLGFFGSDESSVTVEDGSIVSEDRNTREVDSVFTTLIRMRDALEVGDDEAFAREVERLDTDIERVTFSRSEIGTRLKNLEAIGTRIADEQVSLRASLSEEVEADLVEVISEFTAKQASLQASYQISGTLLSLSILDFV